MAITSDRASPLDSAPASRSRSSGLLLEPRDGRFGAAAFQANGSSTLTIGPTSRAYLEALADLTERWERGETPGAELYLDGLSDWTASQAVELIYREFRLAEVAGRRPSPDAFLARFPEHREALETLFRLDGACSDSLLRRLFKPRDDDALLPRVGDEIGPYILKRELGRGGFARVFLAEQADLEYRLVVVKISTRPTREPWLLARARHANIVEIVSHAEVDDGALQMICMPFRGGATLSAILGRRRERPTLKNSDRRLLDDLDAVAAPEYPATQPARPARELLRTMTDVRAFASIVARLAEALDHACSQGVAHGDVKPSNILLTADGVPMLLDFNLAQDWSFHDPESPVEDPGGTLAYMAPERLRALAATSLKRRRSGPIDSQGPTPSDATAVGPHCADVYSLGMVLLEAVAGWSPTDDDADDRGPGPAGRWAFGEAAERYAAIRERGAAEVVRRAEQSGGATVPPALRSILTHCLEADPSARYGRALELAEDLDRWRADRPLAFAPEPSRRRAIGRWTRRNRRGVAIAAFAVALSTLTAAVFVVQGSRAMAVALEHHAVDHLALSWDDVASPAFHYQRPGFPSPRGRDSAEETGSALRALKDYKILEPGDWREQDNYRFLPAADRDDLELWLVEQTFRACRALANRPDSPDDWLRARTLIDRVCGAAAPRVLAALRNRLDDQLATVGVATATRSDSVPASPCIEEYLQGVAAELDDGAAAGRGDGKPGMKLLDPKADPWADVRQVENLDAGLTTALEHYRRLLSMRPDSFWGHYRSATIAFRLRRWAEAAAGIETCLRGRPNNPILHGFLATCLFNLDRSHAALDASNRALDAAPDHAEFVQTRAFIRAGLPESGGLEADIRRYEMLKSLIPESFFRSPPIMDLANPIAASVPASRRGMPLARPRKSRPAAGESSQDSEEIDPGELTARAVLAAKIRQGGKIAIAAGEIDKILAIDPLYIVARIDHMCLAIETRRFNDARDDLDLILDDPRLIEYVVSSVHRAEALFDASRCLAVEGEIGDALRLAKKTLKLILAAGKSSGRAYYTVAAVESLAARTEPNWIPSAADHLQLAIAANRDYEQWFLQDEAFTPVRIPIRAILNSKKGR
ncbi:MAG: serine/threonine-protein kinase [Paludisphaera borealis]|nr:serine/threonine-protein kinase [Paludisphaera borealis]MDR3619435.1 serine/threonine-protein kinase [Paludisphaera borealis]